MCINGRLRLRKLGLLGESAGGENQYLCKKTKPRRAQNGRVSLEKWANPLQLQELKYAPPKQRIKQNGIRHPNCGEIRIEISVQTGYDIGKNWAPIRQKWANPSGKTRVSIPDKWPSPPVKQNGGSLAKKPISCLVRTKKGFSEKWANPCEEMGESLCK